MSWLSSWVRALFGSEPNQPVTGHPEPLVPTLHVDAEGWLVGSMADPVVLVPSVRHSSLSVDHPIAIVWHYTATDYGTAESLADRIRTFRRGHDRAASWHVLIAEGGTMYQSVPFLRGAWHCAKGIINSHRVNACSVGVELEGHGSVKPTQLIAAHSLMRALMEAYQMEPGHMVYGHSQFDPARRSDPGLAWLGHLRSEAASLARSRGG